VNDKDKTNIIPNPNKNCQTEGNNYVTTNNNNEEKKEIVENSSRRNISGIGKNFENFNLNSNQNEETIENNLLIGNYCSDCFMEIPLRAYHCKICGFCIGTFDHHCSYVYNCIGEKNKYLFHLFISFHSFFIGFCIIYMLLHFEKTNTSKDFFKKNWVLFIISLISILLFSFIFSLVTFQFQILFINQTTYENYAWHKIQYMKKLSGSQNSPFNLGFVQNFKIVYRRNNFLKLKRDDSWNFKDMLNWKLICNIK
jgi:palmitoyltransferase